MQGIETVTRTLALILALVVAAGCGGGKKAEGDADADGDVVDEDVADDLRPDPSDAEDVPEEDGAPDVIPDPGDAPADAVPDEGDPVADVTPDAEPDVTPDAVPDADDVTAEPDAGEDDALDVLLDLADDLVDDDMADGGEAPLCVDPVSDGRFLTTTAWTTTGVAAVNPTATGHLEAGEGELPAWAVCSLDTISQSFTVPTQTDCGPARLDLWLNAMTFVGGLGTAFASNQNGNYYHFHDGFLMTWTNVSNCLGEAAYSGALDLVMGAAYPPTECDTGPSFAQGLRVDNVEIWFDPTCPYVGEIVNGDLEATTGFGWHTESTTGASAETDVTGIGTSGSYGARIHLDAGCQEASMWVPMSVPMLSTMASPALSFQAHLSAGEEGQYSVGDIPEIDLEGTGAYGEVRMCLPHHLSGGVYDVTYHAAFWGTCGVARGPLDFIVDDLQVINDITCLHSHGMLDSGFEMSTVDLQRYGWIFRADATSWGGTVISEVVSDVTKSKSGTGSAHLSTDQRCDWAMFQQAIELPASSSTEGPALKFWYNYPSPMVTDLAVRVNAFHEWGKPLAEFIGVATTAYDHVILCLPPELAGRPAVINASLSSSGLCADFFSAPEHAWFDDFELSTDSTCPTI